MADNSILSFDNINMPYSLEAEQAVLGSILVDPSCLSQAAVFVNPESFYLPQHQAIFAAMLLLRTAEIGYYMIVLAVTGTLAGVFVGLCGALLLARLKGKSMP